MVINCGSSKKLLTDLYGREKQVKINQDIFLIVTQITFLQVFCPSLDVGMLEITFTVAFI